jgi:ribosomal protein S18 acetylase RimI-like enzyme
LDVFDTPWQRDEFVWLAVDRPPMIYLGGLTLRKDATAEQLSAAPAGVYDCWGVLDLAPFGFKFWRVETWFIRAPGAFENAPDPPELEIVLAGPEEAEEFEAASARGFGGEDAPSVSVGSVHPPNPDPRMLLWLGRVDGEAVTAAMSYRTDQSVGIFGVATIEPARGRGYATALMRRAVLPETGLPAVLNTDNEVAARLYEGLGFRRVADFPQWIPGPVSRIAPDAVLT